LTGAPSNGLIDVDLDCLEAVRAAPLLLPQTGWVSGRAGMPRSHWWYLVDDPQAKASTPYKGLNGSMLVELRGTRGATVVPPSVHESGEDVVWHDPREPARVRIEELHQAVREVAAAALLARHWPAKGSRQDASLALAGGLLRAGWNSERAGRFILAVAVAA